MQQQISVITLGIGDLARSRRFYADGFGWTPVFGNDEIAFYQRARGRFVIEGLMPGEYELSLSAFLIPAPGAPPPPVGRRSLPPVKQNVTVTSDAETQVTLVLDVGVKEKDG